MWWLSCCSSLEGESSSHDNDSQLDESLLQKRFPGSNFLSNSSSISAQDTFDSTQPIVLPDLAEPKSNIVPLCLHRSCTDELSASPLIALEEEQLQEFKPPRRCVSSEMTGVARSLRVSRTNSGMHVEDVLEAQSSPLKRRARKGSQVHMVADASGVAATTEGGDASGDPQNGVVYSSWFALLSKSIGSDVGSPAWLLNSTAQIEGA